MIERFLDEHLSQIADDINGIIDAHSCRISSPWPISQRCMAESGGRLLEDFLTHHMQADARNYRRPESSRTIEDFSTEIGDLHFLVDLKCANVSPGFSGGAPDRSRPNLVSIRKAIDFYESDLMIDKEIVILILKYSMHIATGQEGSVSEIEVQRVAKNLADPGSKIFYFSQLSETNMYPANIGSGGQILLSRGSQLETQKRTRSEIAALLRRLQVRCYGRPSAKALALSTAP